MCAPSSSVSRHLTVPHETGDEWRIRQNQQSFQAPLIAPPSETFREFSPTILLLERIQLVREGLVEILSGRCPEYQIRTETSDSCDIDQISPALIIMSSWDELWSLHPVMAPQCLLASSFHKAPVLLIGESDNPDQALMALRAGFAGFFPATQSAEMLVAVVRLVLAGGCFCPPSLIQRGLEKPYLGGR